MSMSAYETSLPDGTRWQGAAHGGSLLKLSTENAASCVSNVCPGLQRRMPRDETGRRAGCRKSAPPVVCPAKAGMFSRRQTCRGRSQSPVVWIAEVMETETLKPIDKVSPGEATSHRAVITMNALWPRK